jgi:hypothetical protein
MICAHFHSSFSPLVSATHLVPLGLNKNELLAITGINKALYQQEVAPYRWKIISMSYNFSG